jgi:surfeit locus 1 family protein
MTVAMLAVLIGLGTWQVHRLAWKQAFLARIDEAESAPAIALPPEPSPFEKVRVEGRLRSDLSAWYGVDVRDTPHGPTMGARLVQPLERDGAPPVLVDRGWMPTPGSQPADKPNRDVTVEGYVRPAERPGLFSPSADPATRHFYTLDPAAIAAALGLPRVAPFVLIALGPERDGSFPDPAHQLPRPPNNHLSYSITWYGLAVALVVIFGSWSRTVLRR